MSSIAVPAALPAKRRIPWTLVLAVTLGLIVVGGIAAAVYSYRGATPTTFDSFYRVTLMPMEVTITKDGELQAVNNTDVVCPIEGTSTIQFIEKEGTSVKKGDVLMIIESSELRTKLETATLELQEAEAELTAAKEQKEIQESTNVANLEAANVDLILARLDLQQYTEGTYPQSLEAAKRKVEMAKIAQKTKEQKLAQNQALFGKGFVNSSDVKDAEIELLQAQNDLATAETDLMVLEKYTHEKDLTEKRNAVVQAEKKFVRTQRENASNLAQKISTLQSEEQSLLVRKRQHQELVDQIEACTVRAPGDGLVVYGSSGSSWSRRETPIQAGASVRFQETVIRLPDTNRMKAVSRIQEAQVTKLRVDRQNPMRASVQIIGVPESVPGWVSNISVMADSSSRWFNPDAKDYPVDITLARTPTGLKPGVGVEVKIFVDRISSALAVPLAAIYTVGKESYVFTRKGNTADTTPTLVKLGQVNDTHAQILDGVKDGDQVLLLSAGQGRELLERAGVKLNDAPTTQPIEELLLPPIPGPPGVKSGEEGGSADGASTGGQPSNGERRGGEGRRRREGGGGNSAGDSSGGSSTAAPAKKLDTQSTEGSKSTGTAGS